MSIMWTGLLKQSEMTNDTPIQPPHTHTTFLLFCWFMLYSWEVRDHCYSRGSVSLYRGLHNGSLHINWQLAQVTPQQGVYLWITGERYEAMAKEGCCSQDNCYAVPCAMPGQDTTIAVCMHWKKNWHQVWQFNSNSGPSFRPIMGRREPIQIMINTKCCTVRYRTAGCLPWVQYHWPMPQQADVGVGRGVVI